MSGQVIFWGLLTNRQRAVLRSPNPLSCLVFSDDTTLVTGDYQGTIRFWRTNPPTPVNESERLVSDATASEIKNQAGGLESRPRPRPANVVRGLRFSGSDHATSASYRFSGTFPITVEAVTTPAELRLQTIVANWQFAGLGIEIAKTGHWQFAVHDSDGYKYGRSDKPATVGKRVHVAGVCDGKRVKLFVDGKLQSHFEEFAGTHKKSRFPFMLGADPGRGGRPEKFFQGSIHTVRFSSVVRYREDFDPPLDLAVDEATLLLLNLDEGSGHLAKDSSGNNYHAQINGAAWIAESTVE